MVYFVGAGCGAEDLITLRGMRFLEKADVIIYAGSLVNPMLLDYAHTGCEIHNSAEMTLEEVIEVIKRAEKAGKMTVRLHTGDQSLYGAVREQMDELDRLGISYESVPGVSACFGAAASLNLEYTLPGISQSLIITRMEGKTKVPEKESIQSFAAHGATMAIYLSSGMTEELSRRLIEGGYEPETPAAIIYKATWPDEEKYFCTVATLHKTATEHKITKTALILVGKVLAQGAVKSTDDSGSCTLNYEKSRLYAPDFETEFRKIREGGSNK
ncbi:precorrin-4 C(11)-methyltransferase [Treponema sp. C6A8]|uniref:precorrin-4 C(11)-methyltransferase n=1 Tax=Treponema sp. C6A8 TaxID=1410609 RepID=UPI0004853777|nr:precorrin-4 C(11)-methyltransferase [Treponema sp. C6A8]